MRRITFSWIAIIAAVLTALLITVASTVAPASAQPPVALDVPRGATLSEVAHSLAREGLIRSEFLFKAYATLLDGTTGVKTGEYLFDAPQSALMIAYRLVNGIEGFPKAKVTIPEGSTSNDIAAIVRRAIPGIDGAQLRSLARAEEGYLFPDTYFWAENARPKDVVGDMRALFDQKTAALHAEATSTGTSWNDIVTMASLIEREATSSTDRRLVAGILSKRLKLGMALQADAAFYYAIGTTSRALTLDDLKMTSPYNLYTHAGLPPTPIADPSLDALDAALHPTSSKYLYYLSGRDGVMHYAETLEEHAANRNKYLK